MKEQENLTIDERDAEKAQLISGELANGCYESGGKAEELINAIDDKLPALEEAELSNTPIDFLNLGVHMFSNEEQTRRYEIEKERGACRLQLEGLKALLSAETDCVFHVENGHFKDYGDKVLESIAITEQKSINYPCNFFGRESFDRTIVKHFIEGDITLEELQTIVEEIIKNYKEQIYGTSTTEI